MDTSETARAKDMASGGGADRKRLILAILAAIGAVLLFTSAFFALRPIVGFEALSGADIPCGSLIFPNSKPVAAENSLTDLLSPDVWTSPSSIAYYQERCEIERGKNTTTPAALAVIGIAAIGGSWFMFTRRRKALRAGLTRLETVEEHPGSSIDLPTLPAGWYPDQADPTLSRWYDGTRWTNATLPHDVPPTSTAIGERDAR